MNCSNKAFRSRLYLSVWQSHCYTSLCFSCCALLRSTSSLPCSTPCTSHRRMISINNVPASSARMLGGFLNSYCHYYWRLGKEVLSASNLLQPRIMSASSNAFLKSRPYGINNGSDCLEHRNCSLSFFNSCLSQQLCISFKPAASLHWKKVSNTLQTFTLEGHFKFLLGESRSHGNHQDSLLSKYVYRWVCRYVYRWVYL